MKLENKLALILLFIITLCKGCCLKSFKVNVVGICSLAHRGEIIDFGCRYETLTNINIKTWEEDDIPDWLNETPITKPGSTGK